jgi:hypothetical protein
MEVALRRRLAGVAEVSISQSQQTAAVTFVSGTRAFSAAAFRDAVAEAEVDVVSLEVDVCGVVDDQSVLRSSTGDQRPFVKLRGRTADASRPICVTGRLDERAEPPELEVTKSLP